MISPAKQTQVFETSPANTHNSTSRRFASIGFCIVICVARVFGFVIFSGLQKGSIDILSVGLSSKSIGKKFVNLYKDVFVPNGFRASSALFVNRVPVFEPLLDEMYHLQVDLHNFERLVTNVRQPILVVMMHRVFNKNELTFNEKIGRKTNLG